jgi:hypothetical protein
LTEEGFFFGAFSIRIQETPELEHLVIITVIYVAELSILDDLVGLTDLCKYDIRMSILLWLLYLR